MDSSVVTTSSTTTKPAGLRNRSHVQRHAINDVSAPEQHPQDIISTKYGGEALQHDELIILAEAFAALEVRILEDLTRFNDDRKDVEAQTLAKSQSLYIPHELRRYKRLLDQYRDIQTGESHFLKAYMQNETILRYYVQGSDWYRGFLYYQDADMEEAVLEMARHTTERIVKQLERISQVLVPASKHFSSEITTVSRRKYQALDALLELAMFKLDGLHRPPPWSDLAAAFPSVPVPPPSMPHTFSALWLTVFAVVSNCITFALAFIHSQPTAGTAQDADFWLLLQSSIMQCFALIIAGLTLWRTKPFSTWWWLCPTVIALVLSIIALPLYVVVPTAWSAFATTVAAAVQAFMTVQLAIAGR